MDVLQRLGIPRWQLRQPPEMTTSYFPAQEPELAPSVLAQSLLAEPEPIQSPPVATVATPVAAPKPPVSTSRMQLRGRVLNAATDARCWVVACAEHNAQDRLLDIHQESGRLLAAMLKTLPFSSSLAMIGVERGEPLAESPVLLLLGDHSAKTVLGPDVPAPYRGRVHLLGGMQVVCTYHPAELRQNPTLKPLAWQDLQLLAGLVATH